MTAMNDDGHESLSAHGYITTFTGARFSYADPTGPFRIRDIAHALSRLPRFLGHTRDFYSVAQHSLFVVDVLCDAGADEGLQAAGLLHDAQEAYFGDVPTPLKWACPEIASFERRAAAALRARLLPRASAADWRLVKMADDAALHAEAACLFCSTPAWVDLGAALSVRRVEPSLPAEDVEQMFLHRARSLGLV